MLFSDDYAVMAGLVIMTMAAGFAFLESVSVTLAPCERVA